VAELELGKVAVKVLLGAVLIDALHPALEDAERALDRENDDARVRATVSSQACPPEPRRTFAQVSAERRGSGAPPRPMLGGASSHSRETCS
jgi:hypothetical protein